MFSDAGLKAYFTHEDWRAGMGVHARQPGTWTGPHDQHHL